MLASIMVRIVMEFNVCRGCILYAMVCGRLPFGDDTQVSKNLNKPLNFPVPITEGT